MSITKITIEDFIKGAESYPILDVRSPGEFLQAHIPNAYSFPIFSNEERKIIGTAYKQESREKAIKLGLDFFGKNMVQLVESAEKIMEARKSTSREIGVHCWRGGMRSAAIAWLLDLYGFKVYLLTGGYKTYRSWALQQFEKKYPLIILSGYTGSDKTGILLQLQKNNAPVIDLEGIASHKGSAFGSLGMAQQPSQEHFENMLALELYKQSIAFPNTSIWLEGESQRIGNLNIPLVFYHHMQTQTFLFLEIPFQKRLIHIIQHYGKFEKDKLINAIVRIKKKLGGLETKSALNALIEDEIETCFSILLRYYDKLYLKSSYKSDGAKSIIHIASETVDIQSNLEKILQHVRTRK